MALRYYRKRRIAEMNVVPYIDVMLVLLIIFMITSPLLTEGVKIELPKVNMGTELLSTQQGTTVLVTVDVSGHFFFQNEPHPISASELVAKIRMLTGSNKDAQVFVKGDTGVAYGKVMEIMALLKGVGIERVSLVTQPQ